MQAQHDNGVALRVEQVLGAALTLPGSHQARHFALCLFDRHTGFQPADDRQKVGTTAAGIRWIELEWHEEFDLFIAARRESKAGWHHADDCSCLPVDLNLFADDVTCAAEAFLPETVSNDGHAWSTIAIFLCGEVAATFWLHSQHIDQASCNRSRSDSQWLALSADVLTAGRPGADCFP